MENYKPSHPTLSSLNLEGLMAIPYLPLKSVTDTQTWKHKNILPLQWYE